ncbi:MAG: BatD family protein [Bacteroidetes bacterium]|nr:BatD family protein [Bacteroidota bacterium]
MKSALIFLLTTFLISTFSFSQGKPVKFTVSVSTDSILMDNFFEVKFTLENADGQNFEAPDFSEHFNVVSGPNFSTSMSMVNGDVTQGMTITYYLEPRELGAFYILPAYVNAGDKVLETSPLEVMVVPNPDGLKQPLPGQNDRMQFNWDSPFDLGFDFLSPETRPSQPPSPKEEKPQEAPKKKRKTTRI